jgi:hypothetical protein
MASQWYCKVLGQEVGPVGFREMAEMVRSGTLKQADQVRRKGTAEWIAAGEVIGLFRETKRQPAQAPPAAAAPKPAPAPDKPSTEDRPAAPRGRIQKRQVVAGAGLVLGLLLLVVLVSAWRSRQRERFPEPQAGRPRPDPDKVLASGADTEQFAWDFRQGIDSENMRLMGGAAQPDLCMATDQGLRFTIPPGQDRIVHSGLRLPFRVQGDFQVTVGYTIFSMPRAEPGCVAGLKVAVWDVEEQWASIERQHRAELGETYMLHRAHKEGGRYRHEVEHVPAGSQSGKLRLQRSGSTLRLAVAEGPSDEFVELRTMEFTSNDLADVRLAAQTEGSMTGIDVAWTEVEIRTDAPP